MQERWLPPHGLPPPRRLLLHPRSAPSSSGAPAAYTRLYAPRLGLCPITRAAAVNSHDVTFSAGRRQGWGRQRWVAGHGQEWAGGMLHEGRLLQARPPGAVRSYRGVDTSPGCVASTSTPEPCMGAAAAQWTTAQDSLQPASCHAQCSLGPIPRAAAPHTFRRLAISRADMRQYSFEFEYCHRSLSRAHSPLQGKGSRPGPRGQLRRTGEPSRDGSLVDRCLPGWRSPEVPPLQRAQLLKRRALPDDAGGGGGCRGRSARHRARPQVKPNHSSIWQTGQQASWGVGTGS